MISTAEVAVVSKSNFPSRFRREDSSQSRVPADASASAIQRLRRFAGFAAKPRGHMHSVSAIRRISGPGSRYYHESQETEEVREIKIPFSSAE